MYSETYSQVKLQRNGLNTAARVREDGRVDISIAEESTSLSRLLAPALRKQLDILQVGIPSLDDGESVSQAKKFDSSSDDQLIPSMNIVIHVVGSRGDVQPFVALGKLLCNKYGHRVRLATHPTFRDLVIGHGLEFFSIGGDPAELMAFMVKNPGLMPGKDALRKGDISRRRKGMYEIIRGCWRSCFEAGDGTGPPVSDDRHLQDFHTTSKPFVADAIIANPPSFAHVHCAEKLGIPLHLMFTMPWSPTQSFPHPLANIQHTTADPSLSNFLSYALVELMTWQGLGDIVNRFRESTLGLEPLSMIWGPGIVNRLRIPYTYCWSPSLIPKPKDWGSHLSISGFFFLSCADDYVPPHDLAKFLAAGPAPIYIGFGSIVVDDPDAMTEMIFAAVEKTGQRALVSKGWGGLGASSFDIPDGIFMLGNVPHDWLFQHVSCVVHHGGAGTTAAGIALGKPTVVVPFFGDQPFWGAMVAQAGAGPDPVHSKEMNAEKLADAILYALKPTVLGKASDLGKQVASESGSSEGAKSFHQALDLKGLRCSLLPQRTAVWKLRDSEIRLCALAAAILGHAELLDFGDLQLLRSKDYEFDSNPLDPIGGGASALTGTISSLMMGVADIPVEFFNIFGKDKGARQSSNKVVEQIDKNGIQTGSRDREGASHGNKSRTLVDKTAIDSAIGAGKGIARIIDAGLKSPKDFTLALAKGFHNAPKLYGDSTVRPVEKITGLSSGLRAASKGLGLGFYDGISGLVTQPIEGAKSNGLTGFVRGVGKGIGGVVLKPGAAIWGVPGYTFEGIYKELRKHFGSSVQNYIIAARTAQGYDEWVSSSEQERLEVIQHWEDLIQPDMRDHRSPTESLSSWDSTSAASRYASVKELPVSVHSQGSALCLENATLEELERAICESVKETSTGNLEEDEKIERAIRASITQLRAKSNSGIGSNLAAENSAGNDEHFISDEKKKGNPSKFDDPGVDSDDDENIKEALRRSLITGHDTHYRASDSQQS